MRLQVNGHSVDYTGTPFLWSLRSAMAPASQVAILNGYQTDENRRLREGDQVVLIQKGQAPSREELEAMLSARLTPGVYQRVCAAKVGIAGLGGLGSNIAMMLARTGIGLLVLADFDTVEPSNLNRQCYSISHLGMQKTEACANQIREINPLVQVQTYSHRITANNAVSCFGSCDIVCEAFDNPCAKAELINAILGMENGPIIVSGSGMAGMDSANGIRTRRALKRLYVCGDETSEAREGLGLMAPRVTVCAGHQANMALRLLMGEAEA